MSTSSVNFTVNEISSFSSGVSDVCSSIDSSVSQVESAVRSTETRLSNVISQLEEQLYKMESDIGAAEYARFDALNAYRDADAELQRVYNQMASMSQEEQRANASLRTNAERNYDAKKRILQSIEGIISSLRNRIQDTNSRISTLRTNINEINRSLGSFQSSAYTCKSLMDRVRDAAEGAARSASSAAEALCSGAGCSNPSDVRINISNIYMLGKFVNSALEKIKSAAAALDGFVNSSYLAQATLRDEIMSATGGTVGDMQAISHEAISELEECSEYIRRAYYALESYVGYADIRVR